MRYFSLTVFTAAFAASLLSSTALSAADTPGEKDSCTTATTATPGDPLCVLITAYRLEQPIDRVGSSVTVLTRDDLQRRGTATVLDALATVPGLSLERSGGVGSLANVKLRGSGIGQVRVMIDGMAVNDVTDADVSFNFGSLLLNDIERIEVLRGPQSALYGSDAMGGVINIITRGHARKGWNAFAEAGSYNTFHEGAGYNGGHTGLYYGISAQRLDTEGFSRSLTGRERDGSHISDIKANIGSRLSDALTLDFNGGYAYSDAAFDPNGGDGPANEERTLGFGQAQAKWILPQYRLDNTFKLGANRTQRNFDEPLGFFRYSSFDGIRTQASYQGDVHLRQRDVATAGVEWQHDNAENTSTIAGSPQATDLNDTLATRSVFGQYLVGLTQDWTMTFGARHDDNQKFGGFETYRITSAYNIPETDTILRATYGTAFKAPSLFQLYAAGFGNPTLQPEESKAYDAGIEQALWNDRVRLGLTGFHNNYDNLITYDFGLGSYSNINQAVTKGVETTAAFHALPTVLLSSSYTYLLSENETNNRSLQRRPKHTATFAADWDVAHDTHLGVQWRYVGNQRDSDFNSAILGSYSTVNLNGSYDIDPHISLYGRVENLLDQDYQEVAQYNAAGLAVYAGIRAAY
jgi:vitamin B12 transporter